MKAHGAWHKLFLFAFLLSALLIFAGCVTVQTNERFYPNGRSNVVTQIYVSNLILTLDGSGVPAPENFSKNGGWSAYLSEQCALLSTRHPGYTCHRSGNWLIIDNIRISGTDFEMRTYDAFPYTVYELTSYSPPIPMFEGFKGLGQFNVPKEEDFLTMNQSALSQIRASGLRYNYFVIMPGEIFEHNMGTLVGNNSNRIDSRGLMVDAVAWANSKTPLVVKSRDLNVPQVSVALFGGMFLFLLFDFAAIWALGEIAKRSRSARLKKLAKQAEQAKERLMGKDPNANPREVYRAPKDSG